MPRDNDKDNDFRRGRRDGGPPKGRSGKPRGPEKKFAKRDFGAKTDKRGFGAKTDRDERPGRRDDARPFRRDEDGAAPRRDGRPRFERDKREQGDRGDRPSRPRGERPKFDRDRPPQRGFRDRQSDDRKFSRGASERRPRTEFGDRDRGGDKPWRGKGEADRGERSGRPSFSRNRDEGRDRPKFARGERADRGFPERQSEDRKFSRGGPKRRDDFGSRDRGEEKPWGRRDDREQGEHRSERPRFSRPREQGERERPRFDRPRERTERTERQGEWRDHPRSEGRFGNREERPRRDDDEGRTFAKRPAFGGRGPYREKPRFDKRAPREESKPKKTGERIAKVLARAGLASRRDAEDWVVQGRVTVNGRVINSPALDVTANDVVAVDGKPLPPRERTRLFLYHKPRGLMTTHADPEGRPTVFDNLPEGLPRLISIGRLDFNTEGLLLLTNDGGLARVLELPDTGWLRRYRARAHGEVTQAQLDSLREGIEVEGVKYGPIEATLERDQGANVWLVVAIREGKNREVRNVLSQLGLEVNRLIRVSYGPFQLSELAEGQVEEVKTRVLREQLGERVIAKSGADFGLPSAGEASGDENEGAPEKRRGRDRKDVKPAGKSAVIADRKGRRVLVQRSGSDEARARNDAEAAGYGPPRRPKRGYHGKRDFRPKDE